MLSREEQELKEQKARQFKAKGETVTKFKEGIAKKEISATDWLRI